MLTQQRCLGRVEYADALSMQSHLVALRRAAAIADQLLVVEHPHVITLGRRAKEENILLNAETRERLGVEIHESVRGGDVTYHGPGQIVFYPILSLPPKKQDVIRYVRDLEEVMIRTLATYGIEGRRISGLSGVWVGETGREDKIGAIGVRMSRWVTSHGFALNANTDLRYFDLIVPCGIRDHGVTSLKKILGTEVDEASVIDRLTEAFADVFDCPIERRGFDMESIQAIVYRRAPRLEILCLKRLEGDFWQPVTGRIEESETPEAAARREVEEETGYRGNVESLNYVHGFMLDPTIFRPPRFPRPTFVREHAFALEVHGDSLPRLDPRTHEAFEWRPYEEARSLQQWAGNKIAMDVLRRRLNADMNHGDITTKR